MEYAFIIPVEMQAKHRGNFPLAVGLSIVTGFIMYWAGRMDERNHYTQKMRSKNGNVS